MKKLFFYVTFIISLVNINIYTKDLAKDTFDLKISNEDFIKILKEQEEIGSIITSENTTFFGDKDINIWAEEKNVNLDEMMIELKNGFENKMKKYKKINIKLINENNIKSNYYIKINLVNIYYVIAPMAFGVSNFSIELFNFDNNEIIASGIIKNSKNIYSFKNELFKTAGIGLAESLIDIFNAYLK
jgi:hypothetical protein